MMQRLAHGSFQLEHHNGALIAFCVANLRGRREYSEGEVYLDSVDGELAQNKPKVMAVEFAGKGTVIETEEKLCT
ncbi:MAG: hypothetical protein ABEJ25_04000 [Candidatus Bipolaricaulia bacterium]